MSNSKLIVSVFAEDRPNLINAISDQVLAHDGNWLESSLSRLCGQFAGLVHIDIAKEKREGRITFPYGNSRHLLRSFGLPVLRRKPRNLGVFHRR